MPMSRARFGDDANEAVSCLMQCIECLSNRMYSVAMLPPPADVVINLHASIDSEAVPSKSLVVHCLQISGTTLTTLRMDPSKATVIQVAAVVDKVETRIASDHNAYSLTDFVEYY